MTTINKKAGDKPAKDFGTKKRGGKAKFYSPPNILRQKVGVGGIDSARLEKAEALIDRSDFDFLSFAPMILERLEKAIAAARKQTIAGRDHINRIIVPIMELKASGGMFQYMLVSEIADIILDFLESLEELNPDGFNILDVHQRTINVIIKNRLKGTGRIEGKALVRELSEACDRYRKKYVMPVDLE